VPGSHGTLQSRRLRLVAGFCILVLVALAGPVAAQELSPRAYWPSPVGTKVLVFGYAYSDGDVLMDPSIPLFDVDSRLNTAIAAYMQSFDLWGRTSNLLVELPYTWGRTEGLIGDMPGRRDLGGFNDLGITLSVNLLGAPAMDLEGFQALRASPHPLLGFSMKVVPPTGSYDSGRLINEGGNRWATRLEFGSILPLHRHWLLELEAGAWFFGDDDDFLPGKREQEPVYAIEGHLVHRFKPGFWASLEYNYFKGGRQTVGGAELVDEQENTRIGGTIVFPFKQRHAIKVGYNVGTRTRFGTDFEQLLVTYQQILP
jgi:hypothetical protein